MGIVNSAGIYSSAARCEPNNTHVAHRRAPSSLVKSFRARRRRRRRRRRPGTCRKATQPRPTSSDVSELSELPEEHEHAGVNGDASMLSAAPSADNILGVHSLQISSSQRVLAPLERRSKVLARELEAEAEAQVATSGAATSSPTGGAKRQRSENDNALFTAVDVSMTGGESGGDSDGGAAAMDVVEPQARAAKRGRRNQDRQSASPLTAVGNGSRNGNDNGQGRVLRSRFGAAAAAGRR